MQTISFHEIDYIVYPLLRYLALQLFGIVQIAPFYQLYLSHPLTCKIMDTIGIKRKDAHRENNSVVRAYETQEFI